ncbi:MAG: hypothetical protein U5R49_10650 [Deltaproteobacteria bacterium]|nr:hypothetical protein [Deltaproteobacteria bacterium]
MTQINYHANSNSFLFDNQMLSQVCFAGYDIAEITCSTKYFGAASSINLWSSAVYGVGVLIVSFQYALQKAGLVRLKRYKVTSA